MKLFLTLLLLIPSLSWGEEKFLKCYESHNLDKYLDIILVINDSFFKKSITFSSNAVSSELPLEENSIEYKFSGEVKASWIIGERGDLMQKVLDKKGTEMIEGSINKVSLDLDIRHLDDNKQLIGDKYVDGTLISAYSCYLTNGKL